jgi:protein SYS1
MVILWAVFHIVFNHPLSLTHLFTDNYINFVSWSGWCETLCTLGSAVVGAYLLSIIVERAKRCVDFTFTLFFIHIWLCTFYLEFPLIWEWWLVHVVSSVLMATLGEYWCSIQELKDIPAYNPARTRDPDNNL